MIIIDHPIIATSNYSHFHFYRIGYYFLLFFVTAGSLNVIFSLNTTEIGSTFVKMVIRDTIRISKQPKPQTDCYGNKVEFFIGLSETFDNTYFQWYRKSPGNNYEPIPNSDSIVLAIENIGMNGINVDSTLYKVLVINQSDSMYSEEALLHVNSITDLFPSIRNTTICSGESFSYSVKISGNPIVFQWYQNSGSGFEILQDGSHITGSQSPELNILEAKVSQSGEYRVSITFNTLNQSDGYPTCIENSSTRIRNLLVRPELEAPVITGDSLVCSNLNPSALIATPATGGTNSFSYQWEISNDGTIWTSLTDSTSLKMVPKITSPVQLFRIIAKDMGQPSCGYIISIPFSIAIIPIPSPNPILSD